MYQLSGWWRRAGAVVIDGIVVGVPSLIVSSLISLLFYGSIEDAFLSSEFNVSEQLLTTAATLAIAVAYYCLIMPRTDGQTLGKMALDIRVVREDGGEITPGFAFKRQILVIQLLFGFVAMLACYIPTLLNYLAPLWDDGNQAWHDKLVNSRVVLATPPTSPPPGQFGAYQPAAAQPPTPFPQQPPFPQAPQQPPFPQAPQQPPFPTAPPADNAPPAPPQPPQPPGGSVPYTPPPGFENPVPEDEK